MGPVIDPKMGNLEKIIGFLTKIQLYLNLYALKMTKLCRKLFINDHIFVHLIITNFSVTLNVTLKTV